MVLSRPSFLALVALPPLLFGARVALALEPQAPELVSVRWDTGEPSVGICGSPRLTANNRFLAFGCVAGDLVPGDTNDRADSFLRDRVTAFTERVSVSSLGQEMPYDSTGGIASLDGSLVVFRGAGPLHPDYGPPPPLDVGRSAIYLRRLQAAQTDLISRAANGLALASSAVLWDSVPQREEILFSFQGDPRVSEQQNPAIAPQLWVRNWSTGSIELISGTPLGELSNGGGESASFSEDGRFVAFVSPASDLGPPAQFLDYNLYMHDRQSGQTQRLSYPWQGGEFTSGLLVGPTPPKVSQDGRFVVFSTNSTEIHPDTATSGGTQVYLVDRQSGQLDYLSATPGYSSFNTHADLSANGRYVAWASRNFSFQGPPNPPADMRAIWALDRQTGQKVNVTTTLGPLHDDAVVNLDLSPDGSVIAFTWRIADPTSPVFARPLLYTVDLLGSPVPQRPATSVPTGPLSLWALLGLIFLLLARQRIGR